MTFGPKIKSLVYLLPDKPGIYQFLDIHGNLLYVGKARNIKKRVASYFNKNQSGKTKIMLEKATDIRHIVVDNESDALLLENNLIKNHQPRYNILLKDDKTFPWICIKTKPFQESFLPGVLSGTVHNILVPILPGLWLKHLLNL